MQKHSPTHLQVCASTALRLAVKAAADREMMTISEFVRRTLIDRLRRDGVNPAAVAEVSGSAEAEASA